MLPRLGLALAALAATLLAVEGVASALAGRLLLTPLVRARLASPPAATDVFAQRSEAPGPARPGPGAAAPAEGVYRVHPDPLVGYTLRLSRQLAVFDAPVHSDALGLRTTPGPPPAPDAPRVAILGDSVAFGYGLRGEETIAARLGVLLGASRGPGEPPVACRTVAMPGWNHANAVHFLLDHLDALAPDIVVYVPVGNDLLDT
ncbi:MAG TPA: hypothetical protein VK824_04515, partial [Planctomycetota bacterium]|nr:hypothetical protein [Planctomycetota bacterium]